MQMMRALVLPIAVGGCAQLFGLDETTGGPDAASLEITRVSVGTTVVTAHQPLDGQIATYLTADGPVTATAADNIGSAPVAGAPPVEFTLPSFAGLLDLGARHQAFPFVVLEHPNPAPGTAGAMFQVQGTLPTGYAAGESLVLYVVGAWFDIGVTAPAVGSTAINATVAPADANSLSGPTRQAVSADDAVLLLRYDATGTLTAAGEAPAFAETATSSVIFPSGAVPGAITAITADHTVSATLASTPAAIGQRLAATQPAPMTAASLPWSIVSTPGASALAIAGPQLRSGAVAATDTAVTTTFGDPFATSHGWKSALSWTAEATRTYTPPGLPAVTLVSRLSTIVDPATPTLDLPAGLPTAITIATTALTSDGLSVPIDPMAPIAISATVDQPGDTLYELSVLRLVANSTSTTFEDRLEAFSTTPTFSIPGDTFKVGELYTLRVTSFHGGFSGVATGDLQMRALPVATGSLDSGVFTAM
jgi:hypothetical protein